MNRTPTPHAELRGLLLGRPATDELRETVAFLRDSLDGCDLRTAVDLDGAAELAAAGFSPDLVVVLQTRSDEFAAEDVRRAIGTFPLARWICCQGTWCESDGRNRRLWPEAIRVPARACPSRVRRELELLRRDRASLPLTAGRDEIFAFEHSAPIDDVGRGRTATVLGTDRAVVDWLAEALALAGFRCLEAAGHGAADVVVWDVDPLSPARLAEIADFRERHRPTTLVAVATMAHPEDVAALRKVGVADVVPKLAPADALLSALARSLARGREAA